MTVNADIPNKFLKGDLGQRQALMSSLPRLTLMLYELSNPSDGASTAAQADKLRQASENYFNMAYQGLSQAHLAKMAIGLRTPDYQSQMPNMLKTVQQDLSASPHCLAGRGDLTMRRSEDRAQLRSSATGRLRRRGKAQAKSTPPAAFKHIPAGSAGE